MLEYSMANNDSTNNGSELAIKEILEDPRSVILFAGYPPWLLHFAAGCCVLYMLIGIPGNLITVVALFRTKKLRNATAVFIMNLSVSDLMFCFFNLPLATSTFWQRTWTHGPLLCRLFPLLRYGLVAVSLFTVLAITINRYVMIGHPRLYPKVYKPRHLVFMVLAIWISGFGALVATWFEQWGRFGLDPVIGSCSILPDINGRSPKEFLFILAFLAPCIAIMVCYARIFYIVRKTALKSRRREKVTTDLVKANIESKYTKNFEDSAIGSSCGATLTTTENGGSPTKCPTRNNLNSSSSSNIITCNHRDNAFAASNYDRAIESTSRKLFGVESSRSEESAEVRFSGKIRGSPNEMENGEENSVSDRNESSSSARMTDDSTIVNPSTNPTQPNLDSIGNLRNEITAIFDYDECCSNFKRSVEFIPFIDTCNEQQQSTNVEVDSARVVVNDNSENDVSRSIPNLRFFEADTASVESDVDGTSRIEEKDRVDRCLKVPSRLPRCLEKEITSGVTGPMVRSDSEKLNESTKIRQILDTKSLRNDGKNGVPTMKRFLIDVEESDGPSCQRSIRHDRYDSELSVEYVVKPHSPSEELRGESARKSSVFRRESRFCSAINRAFETGKMTAKDKKLLKMILVIFSSFLICHLPITIAKTFRDVMDWRGLNITGYILMYLTTCLNPVIYVVMSSEYRSAYKNVLLCRNDSTASWNCRKPIDNVAARADNERRKRRDGERRKESIN